MCNIATYIEQIKSYYKNLQIIHRVPNDDKYALNKLFDIIKKTINVVNL